MSPAYRTGIAPVQRAWERIPARWRTIVLALIAGIAPALAHPPFGIVPGLFGFGLLLALLDRTGSERPLRSAFWRGWLAGTAYFLVCTWWVGEAFLVDVAAHGWQAPFAVAFLAGGLGLLWGGAGLTYRYLAPPGAVRVLAFAAVFSVFEWLRGHILTGFPWDLPGEAWRAGGWISQSASLIGAYGLSFVTLALAATAGLWTGRDPARGRNLASGAALAVFVLLAGFGAVRLHQPAGAAPSVRLRVVQANVDQSAKWSNEAFRDIVERHLRLTAKPPAAGQAPPQVVVWPEAAIPADSGAYLAEGSWIRPALMNALKQGQILVMGAVRTTGSGADAVYYNSVLVLRRDPGGLSRLAVYDKHHLVPFGEYMPMDGLMSAIGFKKLVNVGDGFTEGPAPAPLRPAGLPPVQPLICYESLFPAFVANDKPRPAWIVNVSNDAWFGRTSGPWQHLNLASYRAIEDGLPLVRATPTGVSAIVDANGRSLAHLGLGIEGVIDADLPAALPSPPYRWMRDWAFWLMIVLGLAPTIPGMGLRGPKAWTPS